MFTFVVIVRRVLLAARDARLGRRYRYPVCCVAAFCWDVLLGRPPAQQRLMAPGMFPSAMAYDWVPCGVFHSRPTGVVHPRSLFGPLTSMVRDALPGGVFWSNLKRDAQAAADRKEVALLEKRWWAENYLVPSIATNAAAQNESLDRELDWS